MDSFGSFADCIVEGDPEALRDERKLRGLGLAVSVTVQLGILIVLILVPILTPAILPKLLSVVRVPAYRPPAPVQRIAHARTVTQPPYIPTVTSHPAIAVSHATSHVTPEGEVIVLDLSGSESIPDILTPSRPAMPAPPREERHGPVKIGGGVMEALLINRVEPVYPPIARIAHVSGQVVLSAIIATDGSIQSLHVVSGPPLLVGAAADAVRQWRYKPTLLDREPVEVQTLITVNFVLQ